MEPQYGDPRFRKHPTFPELACKHLTTRQLLPSVDYGPNIEKWEKRAPLGKRHYALLKKTACDQTLLDKAYDHWVEMAKHQNSRRQLKQLLSNAENWMQAVRNYEDLRKACEGTEEEKDKFHREWMKKGLRKITKAESKGKSWRGFVDDDCYDWHKLGLEFNVLDFRHESQINYPHTDVDALLGPRDIDSDSDSHSEED